MADLPPYPGSNRDTGVRPDRGSPPSTPRWVKAFAIIAFILVLLLVILQLTGGDHGPRRHSPSGADLGGRTAYFSVTEDQAPSGADPGSHIPPSSATEDLTPSGVSIGDHTPPTSVTEHGAQQL